MRRKGILGINGIRPWSRPPNRTAADLSAVIGKTVQSFTQPSPGHLVITFTDGSSLAVEANDAGLEIHPHWAPPNQSPQGPLANKQKEFSYLQGQYLAYIHNYTKLRGVPPARAELEVFFQVTPPVVNQHIKKLIAKGLLTHIPGQARSLRVALPADEIPQLDPASSRSPM